MMCFANESKVLIEEWDDYRGPRLDRKLGKLAQWLKQVRRREEMVPV